MCDGCRVAARSKIMTPHLYHLDWLSQQEALRAERSRPVLAAPVYRSGLKSVMARLSTLVGRRGAPPRGRTTRERIDHERLPERRHLISSTTREHVHDTTPHS
jgi:hypothetical protein